MTECMTSDLHNRAEWTPCFTVASAEAMCIEKIASGQYDTAQVLVNSRNVSGRVWFARDGFVWMDDDEQGQVQVAEIAK